MREQLRDKEEELLQQRLLSGSKARNSSDADAGPDADAGTGAAAPNDRLVESLRDELSHTHHLLQQREGEVQALMASQRSPAASADAQHEVDVMENMLVAAQNKVVKANQRAAELQSQVVRANFILRAFKHKVVFLCKMHVNRYTYVHIQSQEVKTHTYIRMCVCICTCSVCT